MTTRTIVTSQPDVACDVCERRMLRGEQPDVFIAAGRRRIVCELCAPRAANEGWMRESDTASVSLPPLRPRRGRSLIDRLRQVGRPPAGAELPGIAIDAPGGRSKRSVQGYGFLEGGSDPVPAAPRGRSSRAAGREPIQDWAEPIEAAGSSYPDLDSEAPVAAPRSYLERALEVFNASEFPRRVAGVARSLGPPEVSARSAEHLSSVVLVVVAWELCWYRYEVDLSDGLTEVRVLAQGTELGELPHDDRQANVLADASGTLSRAIA
jgi:hypothetical protein